MPSSLSVLPIEVKSGKDYKVHSALDNFLKTPDYTVNNAIVLSNEREVYMEQGITYIPVYYAMFLQYNQANEDCLIIPETPLPCEK